MKFIISYGFLYEKLFMIWGFIFQSELQEQNNGTENNN